MKQYLTECYVCLQPCIERSPCACQSYVHKNCLIKIDSNKCTICKDELNMFKCFICYKTQCFELAGCDCTDLYAHKECMEIYKYEEIGNCKICRQPYSYEEDELEEILICIKCGKFFCGKFTSTFCQFIFYFIIGYSFSAFIFGCCKFYTFIATIILIGFLFITQIIITSKCKNTINIEN